MRWPSPLTILRLAVLLLALAGLVAFVATGSSDRALVAEIEQQCRRVLGGRDPEVVQRCLVSEVTRRRLEAETATSPGKGE